MSMPWRIEIDSEELEALIDFQENMREGALESLEHDEAEQRKRRIEELKRLRSNR